MIPPKFKTRLDYDQANILMQPTFIRVVDNIRKEAELSQWEISYQEINEPFPSYILSQKKENKIIETNVWLICFQVCFKEFSLNQSQPVEIDSQLFDESGELDWQRLETKTQLLVRQIFNQ